MLTATLNQPISMSILSEDGITTLFPRIFVYNSASVLVTTLIPTHVANGLYTATWTPLVEGYYNAVGQFFLDAPGTLPSTYPRSGESIEVNSNKTNIAKVLGLVHENSVMDQQVYNGDGNLTNARLRVYDSKTNALAAGATGLLFTYSITASYTGPNVTDYKMVLE